MGSGKSSISELLAQKMNKRRVDLDDYIVEKEESSIADIFENKGEIYFRKKETEYLQACLHEYTDSIISVGGGTPCFGTNMNIMNEHENAKTIYLNTSVQELTSRLSTQKSHRPLIAHMETNEQLEDFIRKHLFERAFYYNQSSLTIKTDQKTVAEITDEIISLL